MDTLSQIETSLACITNAWQAISHSIKTSASGYHLEEPGRLADRFYTECQCGWLLSILGFTDLADIPPFALPPDEDVDWSPIYDLLEATRPGQPPLPANEYRFLKERALLLLERYPVRLITPQGFEYSGLIDDRVIKFWWCARRLMAGGELIRLQKTREEILLPLPSYAPTVEYSFGLTDSMLLKDAVEDDQKYFFAPLPVKTQGS